MTYISIVIPIVSAVILLLTFWITRIKNGLTKMTRPKIAFSITQEMGRLEATISIDTLLYSTAEKGKHIQTIFVRAQWGEHIQNFSRWRYNERGVAHAGGLFVNKTGLAASHDFLVPNDGSRYEFLPGEYILQFFVECVGKKPRKISEERLILTEEQCKAIGQGSAAVYFSWSQNAQKYVGYIDALPLIVDK